MKYEGYPGWDFKTSPFPPKGKGWRARLNYWLRGGDANLAIYKMGFNSRAEWNVFQKELAEQASLEGDNGGGDAPATDDGDGDVGSGGGGGDAGGGGRGGEGHGTGHGGGHGGGKGQGHGRGGGVGGGRGSGKGQDKGNRGIGNTAGRGRR